MSKNIDEQKNLDFIREEVLLRPSNIYKQFSGNVDTIKTYDGIDTIPDSEGWWYNEKNGLEYYSNLKTIIPPVIKNIDIKEVMKKVNIIIYQFDRSLCNDTGYDYKEWWYRNKIDTRSCIACDDLGSFWEIEWV